MTIRVSKEKKRHCWHLKINQPAFDCSWGFLAFWENNKGIEAKAETKFGIKLHFARRASPES